MADVVGEAEPDCELVHLGQSVDSVRFSSCRRRADEGSGLAANDTNGQIGVSGSDAATIINSPYSTGQNSASAVRSLS